MSLSSMKKPNQSRYKKLSDTVKGKKDPKVQVHIDSDLFYRFKIKAAADRITMRQIVTRALENYLKGSK